MERRIESVLSLFSLEPYPPNHMLYKGIVT